MANAQVSASAPSGGSTIHINQGVLYANVPYFTATGGTAPYTYSNGSGLPQGITLNADGSISGLTCDKNGSYNSVATTVTDSLGANALVTGQTIIVNKAPAGACNLTFATPTPTGTVGTPYSSTANVTSPAGAYTYAINSGSLPPGVTLNTATGAITGTPTTAGTYTFVVSAVGPNGTGVSTTYTITVGAAAINLSSPASATTQVGAPYSQTNTGSGGTGTGYTYAVSAGSLPAGTTLNPSTGVVSGTPTTAGAFSYSIRVTDSGGNTTTQTVAGTIAAAAPLALTATPSANSQVGVNYSQANVASFGTGTGYSYYLSAGTLPPGTSLNPSTGVVSGIPTAAAAGNTYTYTIGVRDSASNTATAATTTAIFAAAAPLGLTSTPSTNTQAGVAYSQTNVGDHGSGVYTYSLVGGSLPAGTTLDPATGLVSGTPTVAGPFSYQIRVTDSLGATVTNTISGTIAATQLNLTSAGSAVNKVGSPFSQANTAAGGTPGYTYAVTGGSLPAGTTLNPATGVVSGTPTTAGPFSYTITVTDSLGNTSSRTVSGTINGNLVVSNATITGVSGKTLTQQLNATGGLGPYTYSNPVNLPAGLAVSADGLVSGRVLRAGTYTATVTVTDANLVSNTATLTIIISDRPDPTLDSNVIGIQKAQLSASMRFAQAQSDNVLAHLDGTRDCSTNQFALRMQSPGAVQPPDSTDKNPSAEASASGVYAADPAAQKTDEKGSRRDCADYSVWIGGGITHGYNNSGVNRFQTPGVTIGADVRASDGVIVGAAVGYGTDHTDIAGPAAVSTAHSTSYMAYAAAKLMDKVFLDGLLGYGNNSFSSRRTLAGETFTLFGDRSGRQLFATMRLSGIYEIDRFKLNPYLRYEYGKGKLKAYTETGDVAMALKYDDANYHYNNLAAGLKVSYLLSDTLGGRLEPFVRAEGQKNQNSSVQQGMAYVDIPGTKYILNTTPFSSDVVTGGVGATFTSKASGVSGQLEYRHAQGSAGLQQNGVYLNIRYPF